MDARHDAAAATERERFEASHGGDYLLHDMKARRSPSRGVSPAS